MMRSLRPYSTGVQVQVPLKLLIVLLASPATVAQSPEFSMAMTVKRLKQLSNS